MCASMRVYVCLCVFFFFSDALVKEKMTGHRTEASFREDRYTWTGRKGETDRQERQRSAVETAAKMQQVTSLRASKQTNDRKQNPSSHYICVRIQTILQR